MLWWIFLISRCVNGAPDGRIIGCLASMGAGARLNRPLIRKRFCSSKKGVRDRSLELFSKFLPARKLSRSSANENDCAFFKRKTLALDISSASRAKVDGFTLDRALRTNRKTNAIVRTARNSFDARDTITWNGHGSGWRAPTHRLISGSGSSLLLRRRSFGGCGHWLGSKRRKSGPQRKRCLGCISPTVSPRLASSAGFRIQGT